MNVLIRQGLAMGAGLALVGFAGPRLQAQAQAQANAGSGAAAQSQHTIQLVPAQAQLDKPLDAKKLKQGEPVTAKLQQPVSIPDAQSLPKNTLLEGHVDQVQPSEHKSDSTVVVTFDKVRLRGGQELPVKATVMSISEPVFAQQAAEGATGGGAMPAGGGSMPSGGGSMPQSGGGSSSGAAPSAPSAPEAQTPSMPEGGTGSSPQQQSKGVPGVTLQSDIHQQTSATFTAKGKNVKVPGGTQMQMALAVIPPGVKMQ